MKTVLFDLDGTIIDSSRGIINCVIFALEHFGIKETDREKLKVFIGPPLVDSFMQYYGMSLKEAKEATEVYRTRYNPIGAYECTLYEGICECIEKLKTAGYRIIVASSKPEDACRRILAHFGVLDLFDDVVGSTYDGKISTKVQVLNEVQRRQSDTPISQMCLIGDTIFDVEGANLAGISCIGVSYGFGNPKEMLQAGAVGMCASPEEIYEAVRKIIN